MSAVPKPKRPVPQREWQDKAIIVASKIAILQANGVCQYCNKKHGTLVCHHIVSRRYAATSATVENLFPCTPRCHAIIEENKTAFMTFLFDRKPGLYSELYQEAMQTRVNDWQQLYEDLLAQYYLMLKQEG